MVRNVKKLIFIILAVMLMTTCCFADSDFGSLYEQFGADELIESVPEQATDLAEEMGLGELSVGEILSLSPSQFWRLLKRQFFIAAKELKRELFSVLAAVLLASVVSAASQQERLTAVFKLICVLIVTSLLCRPVISQMSDCCEAIRGVSLFMLSYIPVFAAASAASGAVMSAAAYQLPVMAAAQLISQLSNSFFLPLMQSYMLLVLACSIGENKGLKSLAETLKKLINWSLALITTVFSGLLSLQSIFSHAADGAAAKTTKFLVGSFVPVIGSALSDAVFAMQGSLRVIKAGLGSFGILAVLLSFIAPLTGVLALRAVIWLAQSAAQFLSAGEIEGILAGFSNMMSIMQALLLSVMTVMLISTAHMLSLGGGTAL